MAFLHHPRILRTTTTTGDDEIPSPFPSPRPATFRPTITVIVVVLTTFFSCTFLLLLYAKHCKRRHGSGGGGGGVLPSTDGCRNSGVARTVVESLPAFRFGSLKGQKEGLECAVCLNRFEPDEVLRLLPKCKHAFHVECIDVWLDAHSTCPLCRLRVHPEDLLLLHREPTPDPIPESETETETKPEPVTLPRRISGRHSSAGEQCSRNSLVQVVVHKVQSGNVTAPPARGRKDGLLVTESPADREGFERRFSHQIIVSGSGEPDRGERWTEPRPSLFLRSDCLISGGGRSVNTGLRSVSEITGLSRFKLRLSGRDKRQNLSLNGRK